MDHVDGEPDIALATVLNDLPYLQDVDLDSNGEPDVWESWGVTWRDVYVVDKDGEVTDVINLTSNDLRDEANYDRLKNSIVQTATADRVAESSWQNAVEPLDVTKDGNVVPNDVLKIFNKINSDGAGELTGAATDDFLDVNGDGFVSALDALPIIRHLNAVSTFASGEPDQEPAENPAPSVEATTAIAIDAYFAFDKANQDDDDDDDDGQEMAL